MEERELDSGVTLWPGDVTETNSQALGLFFLFLNQVVSALSRKMLGH